MRLHRDDDILPHPQASTVFRNSRFIQILTALVCVAIGVALTWWAFAEGILIFKISAILVDLVFPPIAIALMLRSFSRHNWRMRMDHSGIFVRFRSHLRGRAPREQPEAVELSWDDVASVCGVTEILREKRSGEAETRTKQRSLEIRLQCEDAETLGLAILEDLKPSPPRSYLGIKVRGGWVHHPVVWLDRGAIRVHMHGRRDQVRPTLSKALARAGKHVTIDPPEIIDDGGVRGMHESQFHEHVDRLVQSGDRIAAVRAIRERTGCSLTEAKRTVDHMIDPDR